MPASLRLLLAAAVVCLAGCPAPWDPLVSCEEFDACDTTTPGSTTDDALPTTSIGSGVQTVTSDTGADDTTSPATATDPGDSTGQPAEPPSIVDFQLTPNPISTNGPISVLVTAEHATGVAAVLELARQAARRGRSRPARAACRGRARATGAQGELSRPLQGEGE